MSSQASVCRSGTLAMSIGLYAYLELEAPYGESALLAASAATIFGELVGPTLLRRALTRAGEVERAEGAPPTLTEDAT